MSESRAAHTARAATSPTPSEAGRAQRMSCSSSETDENSISHPPPPESHQEKEEEPDYAVIDECRRRVGDIEIEDVPLIMSATPLQPRNKQQCIAQIIKSELRRPSHVLVKSKSVLEKQEPSCILRHNQRCELEFTVVRSDSISCALMAYGSAPVTCDRVQAEGANSEPQILPGDVPGADTSGCIPKEEAS
ncbi:uncharacterized protein LOC108157957 [Drosophila miranda]|uniref:uncharacterized protein LOC108157957 n=1 Tax=Drosophila miranda TaxID=7229 RepID=UPI00143F6742|nr:uncharacterized protein LOC108157957 [Drosophila miranda]